MVDNRTGSKVLEVSHNIKGIWLTNDLIERKMMYYINTTADLNNLSFGYIYKADVPAYDPLRLCLGLPSTEAIHISKVP